MLPNVGTVSVSRTAVSITDHTYMWSITFLFCLKDVSAFASDSNVSRIHTARRADTAAMKMHALQNTHIAVHNVLSALSGARIEVTEQIKGKRR